MVRPNRLSFSRAEWSRLAGFYGVVAVLHVLGWALYLHHARTHPALVGLGLTAYLFGLRHAFDVDHIAAVDDTVRYLLQKDGRPLGVGFFFALGHSTVVALLTVGVAVAAVAVEAHVPDLRDAGHLIGAGVSGLFLWIVGVLNLVVLLDIVALRRDAQAATHGDGLDELLRKRGLLNRLFGGRLQTLLSRSWQMYPLGLLFGLGFDTASETALLAMAGASAGDLPIAAVLSLPILFAAGMSIVDTTDGVLMSRAYGWAFVEPARRILYNVAMTGLSVVVALAVGSIELLQAAVGVLDLHGAFVDPFARLDLGPFGYLVVVLFVAGWLVAVVAWRPGRPHAHRHRAHARGPLRTHRSAASGCQRR